MAKRRVPKLTLGRLKEAIHYDPETGLFTWKVRIGRAAPGKVIQVIANNKKAPYIYVCLDKERLYAHRVAWFYMTGAWPELGVDHRNGIHNDNRWSNLRIASDGQNTCNSRLRKDNKAGLKGVCKPAGRKRWKAQLSQKHLGYFDTPEEAHACYLAAAKAAYGEFCRSS